MNYDIDKREVDPFDDGSTFELSDDETILETVERSPNRIIVYVATPIEESKSDIDMLNDGVCPSCGEEYDGLAQHFSLSDCGYPQIPDEILQLLTGLVMSDGWVNKDASKPRVQIAMVNKKFIYHLKDVLGWLGGKITEREPEELENKAGFEIDTAQKQYQLSTMTHPDLEFLSDWYREDGKEISSAITLTPTVLLGWYVGDGHLSERNTVEIAMWNEHSNKDKIERMFESNNLPKPSWNGSDESHTLNAQWDVEESKEILHHMSKSKFYPPKGFEYKFVDG